MDSIVKKLSGRFSWLLFALTAAFAAAALRRWQLASAFEGPSGLPISGAPASVTLACVLVMAAAWFLILAVHQPLSHRPKAPGQAHRWDLIFLDAGDPVYPILVVLAAFLALGAAPFLLRTGLAQWQEYQKVRELLAQGIDAQLPTNNGMLAMATAAGALLSFLGLLQMGRDGLHPGRRGKGGFSAALPGTAGCVWLMESFRGHAANPVQWDYAPLLLAIVCGMLFYMDFAGMSTSAARPRRLLWMAAMTLTLSAPAIVSALAEHTLADLLLLFAQALAAAAVLWRLPPNLERPPRLNGTPIPPVSGEVSRQEETTYE